MVCKFKSYWPINLFAFLMDTESLLNVSLQLGKSDYFKSSNVGLNIALLCLKGPQSERNKQFIIKPKLWLSALIIVPQVLMALKQRLSAWESIHAFCRKTYILKVKEIIVLKRMPCKLPPAGWYVYKDAFQIQKHPEEWLLSPPPTPKFGLAEAEHRGDPMHLASQKSTEVTVDQRDPLFALPTPVLSSEAEPRLLATPASVELRCQGLNWAQQLCLTGL